MPVTQKRIYEATPPESLKRLLYLEAYSVTELRNLQNALVDFGNEISEALGSFKAPPTAPDSKVIKSDKYVVSAKGSPEQRNKIFALLKEKPMTSRELIEATGFKPQEVYTMMFYLSNTKQVDRIRKADSKIREYIFMMKPSDIQVA